MMINDHFGGEFLAFIAFGARRNFSSSPRSLFAATEAPINFPLILQMRKIFPVLCCGAQ
jgi:hypothetical protein